MTTDTTYESTLPNIFFLKIKQVDFEGVGCLWSCSLKPKIQDLMRIISSKLMYQLYALKLHENILKYCKLILFKEIAIGFNLRFQTTLKSLVSLSNGN